MDRKIEYTIQIKPHTDGYLPSSNLIEVECIGVLEDYSNPSGVLDTQDVNDLVEYYLKVVPGKLIIEDTVFLLSDYMPQFSSYIESNEYPKKCFWLANYEGSSLCFESKLAYRKAEFIERRGNTWDLYFNLTSSSDQLLNLKVIPASVPFAEKSKFKTSALAYDSLKYGCKLKIGYGLSSCAYEDFINMKIPFEIHECEKKYGFHEKVIDLMGNDDKFMDLTIYNTTNSSIYIERATIYDLLYSEMINLFNSDSDNTNDLVKRYSEQHIVTQTWLEAFYEKYNNGNSIKLHIDLGGEGQIITAVSGSTKISKEESFFISGFENAINLNGQVNTSQTKGGRLENIIPHIILLPNWEKALFPFADGTVDYFTMQSIPIVLPESLDIADGDVLVNKHEYDEIIRCINDRGIISIWCQNYTAPDGLNSAVLASQFINEYKETRKHYGYPEAEEVGKWKSSKTNRYCAFYSHLPTQELIENCSCNVIPVQIEYEELTFLDSTKSIRLDFIFMY